MPAALAELLAELVGPAAAELQLELERAGVPRAVAWCIVVSLFVPR